MNPIAKFAIAAAAVVVVAVAGYNLLGPRVASDGVGVPAPSASPAPAPTSGLVEPGRYRWTSSEGDVTFEVPAGYTAGTNLIDQNRQGGGLTEFGLAAILPGDRGEVSHVYTDACEANGEQGLEPIGPTVTDLVEALDNQAGTDATISSITAAGSAGDELVGQRVELQQAAGLLRATCSEGEFGPLKVWAQPNSEDPGYYAIATGRRGVVYAFERDGRRFVFMAVFGADTSRAQMDEVDAIVRSMELATR